MNPADLTRPHVLEPGSGRPLLLLHGTGDDEHGLLPLGRAVAPGAPLLSPRGTVREGSMNRFWRRLREGVFDEDDIRVRTAELARFVEAARAEHGLDRPAALGFSNGANTAVALLLLSPGLLEAAVLLASQPPFLRPPQVDLSGTRVLVSNGAHDPMATPEQTQRLVAELRERGADVTLLTHPGGHSVEPGHLPAVREFLAG